MCAVPYTSQPQLRPNSKLVLGSAQKMLQFAVKDRNPKSSKWSLFCVCLFFNNKIFDEATNFIIATINDVACALYFDIGAYCLHLAQCSTVIEHTNFVIPCTVENDFRLFLWIFKHKNISYFSSKVMALYQSFTQNIALWLLIYCKKNMYFVTNVLSSAHL